jgi:hypothetical protein
MAHETYRFRFAPDVPPEEVEASLLLALVAVEALHGETAVRLGAAHSFDARRRTCVIDAAADAGGDLARVFFHFLRREFGDSGVAVEHVASFPLSQAQEAPA